MTKELTTDLLKISQLAKATDTNVTTLKYYVKEGLIQPVFKTTKIWLTIAMTAYKG